MVSPSAILSTVYSTGEVFISVNADKNKKIPVEETIIL